jgi:hypothetical protein
VKPPSKTTTILAEVDGGQWRLTAKGIDGEMRDGTGGRGFLTTNDARDAKNPRV